MARQRKFIKDHQINMYHCFKDKKEFLPLTGRIICAQCGNAFKIKISNRISEKGERYYSCKKHRTGYRRKVQPDNCCNGTRLFIEEAHQVFVKAWNYLVDHPDELLITHDDLLTAYRIKEQKHLLSTGKINKINAEIVRRVLDHIVVQDDGTIRVKFLSGVEVRIRR